MLFTWVDTLFTCFTCFVAGVEVMSSFLVVGGFDGVVVGIDLFVVVVDVYMTRSAC